MELLGDTQEPLTLTQVAQRMDTNKTSAQRFLYTLVKLGYVDRVEHKRYCLGNKVLRLAHQFLGSNGLSVVAEPIMSDLSLKMNKSVSFGVLDGTDVLMIYRKERIQFHPYAVHAGSKIPCHCTTTGKVLLAGLSDGELKALIERLDMMPITHKSITSRQKLYKEVLITRSMGYGVADQEFSLDLYSLGVPILNRFGSVVAAASISLSMHDKQKKNLVNKAKDKLIEAGLRISQSLGYEGVYPRISP